MKKHLNISIFHLALMTLLFFSSPAQSQELIPYRKDDKWGFSTNDKKMIIPAVYDSAWPFKKGFAIVEMKGKQGIIDATGKVVVPLQYVSCNRVDDYIIVRKENKSGVVDLNDKIVIPIKYSSIYRHHNGYWQVSIDKKKGIIRPKSEIVIPIEFDDILKTNLPDILRVEKDGKWGLFTIDGKQLTDLKYENEPVQELKFKEGLVAVFANGKWGFINDKGEEVIQLKFKEAYPFYNGMARVGTDTASAFIDTNGQIVVSTPCHILSDFHEGLAQVAVIDGNGYIETKIGYMDLTGETVIPLEFRGATDFYNGTASVWYPRDNYWVKIDKKGNIIEDYMESKYNPYGQMQYIGEDDFIPRNHYYSVSIIAGKLVPGPENLKLPYNDLYGNLHLGQSTHILVDNNLTKLGVYRDIWLTFNEDFLSVKKHKWGCVDRSGKVVIEFRYDQPVLFINGLARVFFEGKKGYITADGEEYFE